MERLVMYKESKSGVQFCMGKKWPKVKARLHGKVDYAVFELRDDIETKIKECLSGEARPIGGGHLCMK